MTIDSELSERSLFSIIDKPVYSIKKHNKYTCMWELKLNDLVIFLYICAVLYLGHLFIPILFMSWGSDSVTYLRIILLIYFSMSIWRLIEVTEIGAYFIVNHCFKICSRV